jgi:hypothetical protein
MLLSGGVTAGMLALVANGALAVGFSISGQDFKVSADTLVANNFVQYGTVDPQLDPGSDPTNPSSHPVPVAVSAMSDAKLYNLCQSVKNDLSIFGVFTLRITAGDKIDPKTGKFDPVTATDMVVDMSDLKGDANFDHIQIGRDASTLEGGPVNDPDEAAQRQARQGFFGQQAKSVTINNLQQTASATTAGQFNLKHLHLALVSGDHECF